MTLAEARKEGYVECDSSYQRGYVTRKPRSEDDIPVFVAGGKRKGQLYYCAPTRTSTQYCLRRYLCEDLMYLNFGPEV